MWKRPQCPSAGGQIKTRVDTRTRAHTHTGTLCSRKEMRASSCSQQRGCTSRHCAKRNQRTTHTVRSVSSWELELHPKPRVRGGRRGRGLTGGRSGRVGQLKSERREARRGAATPAGGPVACLGSEESAPRKLSLQGRRSRLYVVVGADFPRRSFLSTCEHRITCASEANVPCRSAYLSKKDSLFLVQRHCQK